MIHAGMIPNRGGYGLIAIISKSMKNVPGLLLRVSIVRITILLQI